MSVQNRYLVADPNIGAELQYSTNLQNTIDTFCRYYLHVKTSHRNQSFDDRIDDINKMKKKKKKDSFCKRQAF